MRRDPLGKVNGAETLQLLNQKNFRCSSNMCQAPCWARETATRSSRAENLQIQTKI